MSTLHLLLFAAGSSRRMGPGRDKLLERIDGVPLLARQAARAVDSGLPVTVLLPPDRPKRDATLEGLDLRTCVVPDAADGMAASFRTGVAALPGDAAGVVVMLADMPEIETAHLRALAAAFGAGDRVVRATAEDGTAGSPVIFPRRLFPALQQLTGDVGARSVLQGEDVVSCPLPGRAALVDLDTPEAWEAWRAARA